MAETAVPSVRGRTRLAVATVLVVAATLSGAIVGLLAAVLLAVLLAVLSAVVVVPVSAVVAAVFPSGAAVELGPIVVPDVGLASSGAAVDVGPAVVSGGVGSLTVTLLLIGVAVALDASALLTGRPRPLAVGRQVPRQWGQLFGPSTVAALYGARLGVGPLTILSTWTWWAVTISSGLLGPGPAAAVGATFGLVRMLVTVGVSLVALDPGRSGVYRRLGARRRSSWVTINGVAVALVAASALTGCGSNGGSEGERADRPQLYAEAIPAPDDGSPSGLTDPSGASSSGLTDPSGASSSGLTDPTQAVSSSVPSDPAGAASSAGTGAGQLGPGSRLGGAADGSSPGPNPGTPADTPGRPTGGPGSSSPPMTTPAPLEDFVRPTDHHSLTPPPADPAFTVPATPAALSQVLLADVELFQPIGDNGADRFLDLRAAAELQPDPTEEVALLETRGYQGGWTRAFRSFSNDVMVTSVYHFDDAAEAEFYLEDGLITIGGYGGKFFDIDGLPGVRGFAQEFDSDGEELLSLGAAFHAGPRWYLVYLVGSAQTVDPETLFSTVSAQRQAALAALAPADPVAVP